MPLVGGVYTAWAGAGVVGILLRGVVAGICLLPPTLLMGATLPAIARWVETTPEGVSWLGFFYGGNIARRVVGSLLAGFYLLRVHDIAVATYVAVAINVVVAALALAAREGRRRIRGTSSAPPRAVAARAPAPWAVYVAIALSGLTALARRSDLDAAAVAAVRRDGLHVLADPRGVPARPRHRQQRRLGDRAQASRDPRLALGVVPAAAVRRDRLDGVHADAVAAVLADQSVDLDRPLVHTSSSISSAASGRSCRARSSGARAFRWRWPSVATGGQDPARLVGGVYAANTLGAIVGALSASLLLVVWLGTQHAQQVLYRVGGLGAAHAESCRWRRRRRRRDAIRSAPARSLLAVALARRGAARADRRTPVPGMLVAYGRYAATRIGQARDHLRRRGMERVGRGVASCRTAC